MNKTLGFKPYSLRLITTIEDPASHTLEL